MSTFNELLQSGANPTSSEIPTPFRKTSKESSDIPAQEFFADVFLIHVPRKLCATCRKADRGESDEGGAFVGGAEGGDDEETEVAALRCPHNERAAYVKLVNSMPSRSGRIMTREVTNLKSGEIQVLIEWVETKKKDAR